jgi:hypothetical protein
MITAQKELLQEIETLPVELVQEVSDFIGFLKAKRSGSVSVPVVEGTLASALTASATMLLSETALSRDWNTPDEDAVWADL